MNDSPLLESLGMHRVESKVAESSNNLGVMLMLSCSFAVIKTRIDKIRAKRIRAKVFSTK
jgi:hypothetical protein